jgi:7,8-dihydropterin-6-yl-methyl-4-(beta-D-ribofuranosyl)aminobenzene 5'-phosphate synthase
MKISVLTDNAPGSKTLSEHGLSYLIEHDGQIILFDTGQSDLFMHNARIMGIDLTTVTHIVLSHGHYDHGNGLKSLNNGKLVCHPGAFTDRYRKRDHSYIGLNMSEPEIKQKFELHTSSAPYNISNNITFMGEVPRISDFESDTTPFEFDNFEPDFVMDDSGVVLQTPNGIFVVTGCGHAGVVNTLEHAQHITGDKRIWGIMGGFHLKEENRQTRETIKYLKDKNVKHIIPSHCTALPALAAFYNAFGIEQVKTGNMYTFKI